MEMPAFLNLNVGQLAEMKTFEKGFRSAWFRCKIRDISPEENKIRLEYYDFPGEEITWTKIMQLPRYGRKSMHVNKQLMVRPQYPLMCHKSERVSVTSISEVCVIIGGRWKVGDLVDWHEQDCYWSARVTEVLSDDKVQIELPMPPAGEGGTYEAFYKDLRPSLDWCPENGWKLPTVEGQISCSAELVFPLKPDLFGMNSEEKDVEHADASPHYASSSSHISVNSFAVPTEGNAGVKVEDDVLESATGKASSSDSISTSHLQETKADATWDDLDSFSDSTTLNIMQQDTLEAAILDLEELANKVKWMKTILQTNQSPTSSWKFVEPDSP